MNEPGLGSSRTYQPGEMPLPTKLRPGLRRMHQEMNSEAYLSSSQLRAAMTPKRGRVEEEVQTNEKMQDLSETKKEPDSVTKTLLSFKENRDMWEKKLFEDCNKKQGEEIERFRRENKERSERLASRQQGKEQYLMEVLTPRELRQTTDVRVPTPAGRVTVPDPSDSLGDPVVKQTVQKLIETAGRLVTNRSVPGSGVTAPYGAIDDTGRVELRKR